MTLPEVLATKDPKDFVNNRVLIRNKRGKYSINILNPEMGFPDMMSYRNKESNPDTIKEGLSRRGYIFANLGLSSILTTTIEGINYALVVEAQKREDVGDQANKLLSGYIDSRNLHNPIVALEEEIGEELIPYNQDNEIMPGMRNLKLLPKKFESSVSYDGKLAFQMIESGFFTVPNLTKGEIEIEGNKIEGNPRMYFQVPTNSAQLVFNYHLDFPSTPSSNGLGMDHAEISYVKKNGVDIHHSEDRLDSSQGILEVRTHKEGILLIEMDGDKLTDRVYTFVNGGLKPYESDLTLSEAFAPKDNGIVIRPNISLHDFIKMQ